MVLEESLFFSTAQTHAAVTVGICAYNEERNIGPLLESVILQKTDGPIEVVVVSDGSTDSTDAIVKEIAARNSLVKLIRHPFRKGRGEAIDTLFRESSGEIVLIVSADTRLYDGSIQVVVEAFEEPKVGMCWSKLVPINEQHQLIDRMGHLAFRLHDRLSAKLSSEGRIRHATGDIVAIRKSAITKRPQGCVNDDEFLAINASRMGFEVRYIPLSIYRTAMPTTVLDYVNQRRRWVYGHFQIGEMLGEYPTVLECIAAKRPRGALSVVVQEIASQPRDLMVLFGAILLELAVGALVFRDMVFHVNHSPWKMIESTKRPLYRD